MFDYKAIFKETSGRQTSQAHHFIYSDRNFSIVRKLILAPPQASTTI